MSGSMSRAARSELAGGRRGWEALTNSLQTWLSSRRQGGASTLGGRSVLASLTRMSPTASDAVGAGLLGVVLVLAYWLLGTSFYGSALLSAVPFGVVILGMVVQIGYGGQLALSQVLFMGIGAYGMAVLNGKFGWPLGLAALVIVLVVLLLSWGVGHMVARVGGLALGLVTLFFVVMASDAIVNVQYLGGTTGMGPISPLVSGASAASTQLYSGVAALVVFAVATYVVLRVVRSDVGGELSLLGSSDHAASCIGINTPRRRVEAFVLGSVFAAVGGILFAGTQLFVSPTEFDPSAELTILLMLFLGGQASIFAAIIGAFIVEAVPGIGSGVADNIVLIEGALFSVVLVFMPMGLAGAFQSLLERARSAIVRRREPEQIGISRPRIMADVTAVAGGPGAETRRPSLPGQAEGDIEAMAPALAALGLTKHFGGVFAVDDVSLHVQQKGVHCLVGPNGAGKSTLLELLSGGLRVDAGTVSLFGHDVTEAPPWERARRGIGRTFQSIQISRTLSVIDNVAIAGVSPHGWILRPLIKDYLEPCRDRARAVLAELGAEKLELRQVDALTLEEERILELARALVGAPKLVLLDEPASGLSVSQRQTFAETVSRVGQSTAVVLIEHDLELVAAVADIVTVLMEGKVTYEGDVSGFLADGAVRRRLRGLVA